MLLPLLALQILRRTALPTAMAAGLVLAPGVSAQPVPPVAPLTAPASSLPTTPAPPTLEIPTQPLTTDEAEPAATAVTPAARTVAPVAADEDVLWAVTVENARLLAAPAEEAERLATVRQYSYLKVLGYENDWAQVYEPRGRQTGWLPSSALGPTDPPPAYITAAPPAATEIINLPGRIVGGAYLRLYPTPEEEASTARLGHNSAVFIADIVEGTDGEPWYRTSEGDYLPNGSVRLPRPAPRTFPGRWIDADLNEPVMVTAYEDGVAVASMLATKGIGGSVTPTGVFSIQRRVANETMNSETIGIPRGAPGGYYLQNVLYTQYFLPTGEALHYNYWSSNFGYAGSRGCLGLNYADSEFLWRWAAIGTPISISY